MKRPSLTPGNGALEENPNKLPNRKIALAATAIALSVTALLNWGRDSTPAVTKPAAIENKDTRLPHRNTREAQSPDLEDEDVPPLILPIFKNSFGRKIRDLGENDFERMALQYLMDNMDVVGFYTDCQEFFSGKHLQNIDPYKPSITLRLRSHIQDAEKLLSHKYPKMKGCHRLEGTNLKAIWEKICTTGDFHKESAAQLKELWPRILFEQSLNPIEKAKLIEGVRIFLQHPLGLKLADIGITDEDLKAAGIAFHPYLFTFTSVEESCDAIRKLYLNLRGKIETPSGLSLTDKQYLLQMATDLKMLMPGPFSSDAISITSYGFTHLELESLVSSLKAQTDAEAEVEARYQAELYYD